MVSVGFCNQKSKALNDTTWTINTFLASTTTRTTNPYTSLPSTNNVSIPTTTLPFAPGKSYFGGYFSLYFLSNTTNFSYYELEYTFMIYNNSFMRQYNCTTNSIPNYIQFFNTSDFAVNCRQGCMSPSNSVLLGYTNGICLSQSSYMGWSLIKSTFQIVGLLNETNLRVIHEPKNLLMIDWYRLNHYFADIGGYLFKMNSSLQVRPDSGLFNKPPVIMFPMITTIQVQDYYLEIFHLPIMDENDDVLQCKLFFL